MIELNKEYQIWKRNKILEIQSILEGTYEQAVEWFVLYEELSDEKTSIGDFISALRGSHGKNKEE